MVVALQLLSLYLKGKEKAEAQVKKNLVKGLI